MSYRAKVRDTLLSDASVGAIVDTRIYALRAPQDVPTPYVLLSTISYESINTLAGRTGLETARVRCDLYGSSYNELVGESGLVEAICAALDAATDFSALFVFGTELFEDDTKLYHVVLDFSVWYDR